MQNVFDEPTNVNGHLYSLTHMYILKEGVGIVEVEMFVGGGRCHEDFDPRREMSESGQIIFHIALGNVSLLPLNSGTQNSDTGSDLEDQLRDKGAVEGG